MVRGAGALARAATSEQTECVSSDPEMLGDDAVRLAPHSRDRAEDAPPREPGPARPLPRWVPLVAAVVVVALAAGWYVDHRLARHEAAQIVACDHTLRTASHVYDVRMWATYDYLRPSLTGSSARQAELLTSLMALPAREALPDAQSSLQRCTGFHVLAWHSTNLARAKAARAYASALVAQLQGVASRRKVFRADDRQLARLRAAAGLPVGLGAQ